ncbi:MAG: N-acetyltransferase [Oscillospiraceae bacterium]|nr:N-acetyltransferase [Oscillospiraceae bacterium]
MKENDIIIRLEREEDYRKTEELVRNAFWNVYRPGCVEHWLIHVMRDDPSFVKELDLVMEHKGSIIGQNAFARTVIVSDDGSEVPVLTMGPVCISPEYQKMGLGKILLDASLEKAADLGYGAVLIEGNIEFYKHSGFGYSRDHGIRYHDMPEDSDQSFFLCRELLPGYLDSVTGVYMTPEVYFVKDEDADEFDKSFPEKEKLKLPGQLG